MNKIKISVGPVSEGTLKNDELFDAFVDVLAGFDKDEAEEIRNKARVPIDEEALAMLVNELEEAIIDHVGPHYLTFGTNAGDGACFGVWPDWDAIACAVADDELDKVSDASEMKCGRATVVVNDHGNTTYYDANHEVVWECV